MRLLVQVNIDIVRYTAKYAKAGTGKRKRSDNDGDGDDYDDDDMEAAYRHIPKIAPLGLITKPTVIVDRHWEVLVWYLPGFLSNSVLVRGLPRYDTRVLVLSQFCRPSTMRRSSY